MATLEQLTRALASADRAGDMDAARKLAAAVRVAQADPSSQIPGTQIPGTMAQPPDPTIGQQAVGALETGAALATGATTGMAGTIAGTLKGLAEQLLSGEFGTPQAAQAVQQSAQRGGAAMTYAPRTPAGQEMTQAAGAALESVVPPFVPVLGQAGQLGAAAKFAAPVVGASVARVAAPVASGARRAGEAVTGAARAAGEAVGIGPGGAPAFGAGSIGAAETPAAVQRITTASLMPVPFEGKSALTSGQASRNFSQLQFEKETAKLGDLGAPLRERAENQTATMIQNFDALIDTPQPLNVDRRGIGMGVDRALVNRAEVRKREIRKAYEAAEKSGDMLAPVSLAPLATRLQELQRFEGVASNIAPIKREALRLGALVEGEDGSLIARPIPLKDAELLRQFTNEATDWMSPRDSLMARRINESIDAATEGQGGEAYRAARRKRAAYANEFENVGLTARLLGSKGKTSERKVAFEDVFDKVIISSPVEEMNKLRGTLLRAGPDGKQAWADLKAEGINYIKETALSPSQRDSRGNPLLSPDKLNRTLQALDRDGKLEALYGKKQAQTLRDLGELATVIYTAPPGSINTSNTTSALRMALDSMGTFAVTGIPAPAVTALREATKLMKDRKTKARIEASLGSSSVEKSVKSKNP